MGSVPQESAADRGSQSLAAGQFTGVIAPHRLGLLKTKSRRKAPAFKKPKTGAPAQKEKIKPSDPSKNHEGSATRKIKTVSKDGPPAASARFIEDEDRKTPQDSKSRRLGHPPK
jgi:hypothetical protein